MHNISPLFLHNMAKIPMSGPQWCFRQNKQTRFAKDPYGRDRQQDRLGAGRTGRSQRCNPYMQDPLAKYRDVQQSPLLVMIISDLHPHTIVEEPGFVQFFQSIMYDCPSANVILSELQTLFLKTTGFVQDQLERVHNVTLTCEVWKTTARKTYMTTSCHLIDDGWTRKSLVLETTPLPEEYEPSNVVLQLLRIAKNWRVENKIKVVVTNVGHIEKEMEKCGWEHIACFACSLDEVFKLTLILSSDWKTLVQRCCDIVEYFSQNVKAQSQLKEAQSKRHLSSYNLVECQADKWISSLQILERIEAQREAISEVLINVSKVELLLSEHEHNNINKAILCLRAFQCVVRAKTAKRYSLLSDIIPQVEEIKKKLTELQQSQNEFAKEITRACDYHFRKIIETDWVTLSTALDLRYRDIVLSEKEKTTGIKNKIICELDGVREVLFRQPKLLRQPKLFRQPTLYRQPDKFEESLNRYFKQAMLPRHWDPLAVWNFPKNEDLDLSEVARKYLTVVSTAVPVDVAYDIEKAKLVASRRSSLYPEHLNMMLFLNSNSPYLREQRSSIPHNLLENLKI
ncbi:E3 SUMO-protein ligase ZBED1 isoform X2 [Triplophysa dalaica]|uniref:E3 SUMO-protein ligase ZBED1 isoform X2 n=1 Tax=Triplophysa dalaica TaxID=1582913 RepID=UPI0024DF550F|nr:E3 SUMO-protein ligase ZBED1 isoform X2 [Triplophysa dalaica]